MPAPPQTAEYASSQWAARVGLPPGNGLSTGVFGPSGTGVRSPGDVAGVFLDGTRVFPCYVRDASGLGAHGYADVGRPYREVRGPKSAIGRAVRPFCSRERHAAADMGSPVCRAHPRRRVPSMHESALMAYMLRGNVRGPSRLRNALLFSSDLRRRNVGLLRIAHRTGVAGPSRGGRVAPGELAASRMAAVATEAGGHSLAAPGQSDPFRGRPIAEATAISAAGPAATDPPGNTQLLKDVVRGRCVDFAERSSSRRARWHLSCNIRARWHSHLGGVLAWAR